MPNPWLSAPILILFVPLALYSISVYSESGRRAWRYGWCGAFLGLTPALYWIVYPVHQVGRLPLPLAVPCVMLLAAYLAVYPACFSLLCVHMQRVFTGKKKVSGPSTAALLLFLTSAALTYAALELVCSYAFTGFPWFSIAGCFAPWPAWIQAACLGGGYGLTAWYCAGSLALGLFLYQQGKKRVIFFCLSLVLLAAPPIYGTLRLKDAPPYPVLETRVLPPTRAAEYMILPQEDIPKDAVHIGLLTLPEQKPELGPEPSGESRADSPAKPVRVILVQGNVDQNQKWDQASLQLTIDQFTELSDTTLGLAAELQPYRPPALLLWPETAMPFPFAWNPDLAIQVRRLAVDHRIYLGFGTLYYGPSALSAKNNLFNRLHILAPDGTDFSWYDKQHLVPFGEYIPFSFALKFLENILQGVSFSSGIDSRPILLPVPSSLGTLPTTSSGTYPGTPPAAPQGTMGHPPLPAGDRMHLPPPSTIALGSLLCYEAIFPDLAQDRVEQGAEAFITISNDAWFGNSPAPRHHLALSALRSVEQYRPMLRATNTGLTTIIDKYGRYTPAIPLFADGAAVVDLLPETELTLYHAVALYIKIVLGGMLVVAIICICLSKQKF